MTKAEIYGNFLSLILGHYDYWKEIQRRVPELYYEEYENIPRGRVVYNMIKKQFVLLSSKSIIKNKSVVKAIKGFFSIPGNTKLIKKSDFHYEIRYRA